MLTVAWGLPTLALWLHVPPDLLSGKITFYRNPWKIRIDLLLFKLKHSFNCLLLSFPSLHGCILCLILQ